jgi:flagellar protein FlaG
MNVKAVPFEIGLIAGGTATSAKGPVIKNSPPGDVKPTPVESDRNHNPAQAPVQPVVNGLGMSLEFSVDKETGATIIKVLDVETGQVVRQIPPEEVLAFMRQFEKNGPLLSRWL